MKRIGRSSAIQRAIALATSSLSTERALEVEVEPAAVLADLAAGDRAGDRGAQQMHRAVHAHQAVAARPVDLGGQLRAGAGRLAALGEPMGDALGALGRILDRERAAAVEQQPAAIARLAAAGRIEHGPVEIEVQRPRARPPGLAARE